MISVFKNKEDCCGCTACYSVCPTKAISMKGDEEGFLYPEIDSSLCIDCQLCKKVCPIINNKKLKN
ncbi:MAG: (Fe-S)-binding protein [Fusobacteriia bacterium 4572_74]|nr:MAG: (Fe-S)-binding protein [Fusobacteriia bacterium 4572_74]